MPPSLLERTISLFRAPRFRKTAAWAGGLFAAFGLLGFLAAPPLLKSLLTGQLEAALQRKVSIESLALNPYTLSASVAGLSVKTPQGQELFGFDTLHVDLEASSLWHGGPVVRELRLDGPRLQVTRLGEAHYDISDLVDKWSRPSDSPTPPFALGNIQVSGGKLVLLDQPSGARHTLSDLALRLPFISSLPYYAEIYVEPHFSARIDGAPLLLQGRSKPFADSHESELNLDLEGADLLRYLPYLPLRLPVAVQSGKLGTQLRLLFRQTAGQAATLQLAGSVRLQDLALQESGGRPLLAWKRLDVAIAAADLPNRRLAIDSVLIDGLESHARIDPQGGLNWLALAQRLAGPPAAEQGGAKAATWSIGKVKIENGTQHWRDESHQQPFTAVLRDVQIEVRHLDGAFAKPLELDAAWTLDAGPQFRVKRGEMRGARIDVAKKQADLGEIALDGAQLRLLRDREGRLVLPEPPRQPAGKAPAASDGEPWVLAAERFDLSDGVIRYQDQGVAGQSEQIVDGIHARIDGFSTAAGKKAQVKLEGRVNGRGGIKVGGEVQLEPWASSLDLEVSGFPLLPIQPYFGEYLNLTLTRGQLSGKGKLELLAGKEGPGGGFKGELSLSDLHSIDKLGGADFLQWKSLAVGNIDVRLRPFALSLGEVALSDFYARLLVSPDGKLNLMQIVRRPENPAPAAAGEAAPIRIGKVTLQGGTINFSDYFVKPNYTVNVTRIGGRITGLSSAAGSVGELELRGSYGNAAPVAVQAKLNPLAAKAYLDLKGEIRGVDLTSLSTYAGKYAGYAIDKGKLSLYVAYRLDNGRLAADNRVFLDQLAFGDKVESPQATSLPVKLAVALLQNGRGEIDVNLPISGSLDDPQFSLGGVLLRVVANLLVKAATSPFALLGSLFGDGEELSRVDFEAGRASLGEATRRKLEALAKAMRERPALKLEIAGGSDAELDREGLKRLAVERAVKAEKLKEQLKRNIEGASLDAVQVAAQEYPVYLQRAYKEAKFPKPRNLLGLQKELPPAEMEKLLLANSPVGEEDLRQLGLRRAEAVQSWLEEEGKVAMERLFLLPAKAGAGRVDFSLR